MANDAQRPSPAGLVLIIVGLVIALLCGCGGLVTFYGSQGIYPVEDLGYGNLFIALALVVVGFLISVVGLILHLNRRR